MVAARTGARAGNGDTVAILERLHELYPEAGVWPRDAQARAWTDAALLETEFVAMHEPYATR